MSAFERASKHAGLDNQEGVSFSGAIKCKHKGRPVGA